MSFGHQLTTSRRLAVVIVELPRISNANERGERPNLFSAAPCVPACAAQDRLIEGMSARQTAFSREVVASELGKERFNLSPSS